MSLVAIADINSVLSCRRLLFPKSCSCFERLTDRPTRRRALKLQRDDIGAILVNPAYEQPLAFSLDPAPGNAAVISDASLHSYRGPPAEAEQRSLTINRQDPRASVRKRVARPNTKAKLISALVHLGRRRCGVARKINTAGSADVNRVSREAKNLSQ